MIRNKSIDGIEQLNLSVAAIPNPKFQLSDLSTSAIPNPKSQIVCKPTFEPERIKYDFVSCHIKSTRNCRNTKAPN